MAYCINPDLSEDEIIALLCGEFGGISSSILQDAISITTYDDMRSNNEGEKDGDEATEPETSAERVDAFAFTGLIDRCKWPGEIENADEALVAVINGVIIATELEHMNEDVGHKGDSKLYGSIVLLDGGSRVGQTQIGLTGAEEIDDCFCGFYPAHGVSGNTKGLRASDMLESTVGVCGF